MNDAATNDAPMKDGAMNAAATNDAARSLAASLGTFVRAYQGDAALVAEQRGWSLVMALRATDAAAEVRLRLTDGLVTDGLVTDGLVTDGLVTDGLVTDGLVTAGDAAAAPTLVVSAALQTLRDVLELRCDPNEPYLFGELTVIGAEADFLRLDYIASRLCTR